MRKLISYSSLSFAIILIALNAFLQACSPVTNEPFVPRSNPETLAYIAVSIKTMARSMDAAYTQHVISQQDAVKGLAYLQSAKNAVSQVPPEPVPPAPDAPKADWDAYKVAHDSYVAQQNSAISAAQTALALAAAILDAQEKQP